MYKVKLLKGGRMGDIAMQALQRIARVQLVENGEFDILFSASYPGKIPQQFCKQARMGSVNIHTSLLPEGRGSNPLNWALIWGRNKTGITIHKITDTYDAGDICYQTEIRIAESDTIVELRRNVEEAFPGVIKEFFESPELYLQNAAQQNQAKATYAQKRLPEDSQLNMDAGDKDIINLWRSCHPIEYPAYTFLNGAKLFVLKMKYRDDKILDMDMQAEDFNF